MNTRSKAFRTTTLIGGIFSILSAWALAAIPSTTTEIVVSVPEQRLALLQNGKETATFPVSTSKFGLGDSPGRFTTPIGKLVVAAKIGDHMPVGEVMKHRRATGEVLRPQLGRDPIVTRILWLKGVEACNRNAYARCIYIHGTPEESLIGRPASYGCVRMRSLDVVRVFNAVQAGTLVDITNTSLRNAIKLASR